MRSPLALAALSLSSLAAPALAQGTWTHWADAGGQLTFDHPAAWQVHPLESQNNGAIRVMAGAADYECQIWSLPRETTAALNPESVRARYQRPLADTDWAETVADLPEFKDALVVTQDGVDTSRDWPLQHVTLQSADHRARATLQGRPGRELLSICQSYDGQNRDDVFARIEASITMPATAP